MKEFRDIYTHHKWLGESKSGPGSDFDRTIEYRELLAHFLESHQIESITDLGCGEWSFSQYMDFSGINYMGIDTVASVIAGNQARCGSSQFTFRCIDAVNEAIPQADLLIVKEVLQHLPLDDVHRILAKSRSYRYTIFVNDIAHTTRPKLANFWQSKEFKSTNTDIRPGDYRLLALNAPPFSLGLDIILEYENVYAGMYWKKQVLLQHSPGDNGKV